MPVVGHTSDGAEFLLNMNHLLHQFVVYRSVDSETISQRQTHVETQALEVLCRINPAALSIAQQLFSRLEIYERQICLDRCPVQRCCRCFFRSLDRLVPRR